jgi:hypothetical protein
MTVAESGTATGSVRYGLEVGRELGCPPGHGAARIPSDAGQKSWSAGLPPAFREDLQGKAECHSALRCLLLASNFFVIHAIPSIDSDESLK